MTVLAMGCLLVFRSARLIGAAGSAPVAAAAAVAAPLAAAPPATLDSGATGLPPRVGGREQAPQPPVSQAAAPCPALVEAPNDSERALLLDLRKRRVELQTRESALAQRESMASAAEKRLAARVAELNALQGRLEALEAARRDRDETGWRGLVRLYEAMKPRDAAAILNDLDLPVLVQIADRMREAKAAPVIAAMLPDRARALTAALAQLRAQAVPAAEPGHDHPQLLQ